MIANWDTIAVLWPEAILLLMAAWIYLGGAIQRGPWWLPFALMIYAATGVALYRQGTWWREDGVPFLSGPVRVDFLGYAFRWFSVLLGILFTLLTSRSAQRELRSEVLATLMLLIVGLMLVSRANELVFLFVALELVSIPTYVLLYLGRKDRANAEAAAKYFFLSILSSGMFLYGVSFLYGINGTTLISGPESAFAAQPALEPGSVGGLAPFAIVLLIAGLGFKITAVPFHFYAPDVYQGATNANAGVLAVVPKIAGMLALIRLLVVVMPQESTLTWQLIMVLAMITMTMGNVCALWQTNLRRLMAYSSIAHAGYMLIGLAVAVAMGPGEGFGGVAAILLYLFVYSIASLGTFAALASLRDERGELSGIASLSGLGRSRPLFATALAVFMFSLAGIPPLAGFWGKLTLFSSSITVALEASDKSLTLWFLILAIVGAINAAIAAAYYLRIVATMYFRKPTDKVFVAPGFGSGATTLMAAVLVLAIGVAPRRVIQTAGRAERGLARQAAVLTMNRSLDRPLFRFAKVGEQKPGGAGR